MTLKGHFQASPSPSRKNEKNIETSTKQLHLCRSFRPTFSQCRTRIALHPLKCPVAPVGGGSHLNFALHRS